MIGRWFVGFVVFVGYLCLGAFVFYSIERKEEEKRHYLEILERLELKELLAKHYTQVNAHVYKQFVQQLNVYCNKTVLDEGPDDEVHHYQWTYYNAFFFALTTLSTIGYGNLHPTSCTGRILVLVYSLIGIPLNGIVLTQLGSFFESRILRAHYSYKTQRMMGPQLSLIVDIITYLIPGIIVFILIPSGIISYFEEWTFDESVYFAFVTLTTIGYGDYVAGQTVNTNIWYNTYKVFLVFWIMFGLGYLFMILSFISRALRSKTLEHLFLERFKQTHSKIWQQFTKDVVYIRRILNESYLLKFKPVYKEEVSASGQPLRRSRSAPDLSEWPVLRKMITPGKASGGGLGVNVDEDEDEETVRMNFEKHRLKRRRALSQNKMRSLLRRTKATSEIDLAHIDKEATFGADIASYEILSRVVDALETAVPNNQGALSQTQQPQGALNYDKKKAFSFSEGVQGFSSEDIMAGEKNEWTVGGDMLNRENTFMGKHKNLYFDTWGGADDRINYKKFNEYSKNGSGGHHSQHKSRVPKLRRMSTAAFNFLSNNIAPKWLTDKLTDSGDGNSNESTDNSKHRLSLNDDHNYGYGYGSTHNGTAINHTLHNHHNNYNPYNTHHHNPTNNNNTIHHDSGIYGHKNNHNHGYAVNHIGRPLSTYAPVQEAVMSSAPEHHSRHRRQSSPDQVLEHCANSIAVADFLMTLQRSLDNKTSEDALQPAIRPSNHETLSSGSRMQPERRSPLFTMFQDRRITSSAESWQYSSLTSTLSSSTATGAEDAHNATAIPMLPASNLGTINTVQEPISLETATNHHGCQQQQQDMETGLKKSKKKRTRRFSIRPTTAVVAPAQSTDSEIPNRGWTNTATATNDHECCKDVRLNIED